MEVVWVLLGCWVRYSEVYEEEIWGWVRLRGMEWGEFEEEEFGWGGVGYKFWGVVCEGVVVCNMCSGWFVYDYFWLGFDVFCLVFCVFWFYVSVVWYGFENNFVNVYIEFVLGSLLFMNFVFWRYVWGLLFIDFFVIFVGLLRKWILILLVFII